MFAALAELIPLLFGEGGSLAGLLGRTGLAEAAGGGRAAVAGEGKLAEAGQDQLHQQVLSGKMSPEDYLERHLSQFRSKPKALPGWVTGGGGGNIPPKTPGGNTAGPPPDGGDKGKADQIKSDELQKKELKNQEELNRQKGKEIQQGAALLGARAKEILLQNALAYASYKLIDAFNSLKSPKGLGSIMSLMSALAHPLRTIVNLSWGMTKFVYNTTRGLYDFSEGIVESNRNLANYNVAISSSFRNIEMSRMRTQIQQGAATEGSTVLLNEQFSQLLEEVQPFKTMLGTVTNSLGIGTTLLARGVSTLVQMHPMFQMATGALQKIEDFLKKLAGGGGANQRLGALPDLIFGGAFQPGVDGRGRPIVKNRPGERPPDLGGAIPRLPIMIPRRRP